MKSSNPSGTVVLFIHGLEGDHFSTWNFGEPYCWQSAIRAADPNATILSIQYQIPRTQWRGRSMRLTQRAENVLERLQYEIRYADALVVVCHSYGGLLVKEMLRISTEKSEMYASFSKRVKHIVFLSTPHSGSKLANFHLFARRILRSSSSIKDLKYNNDRILDLSDWFRNIYDSLGISIKVYYENFPTHGILVVDRDSANPGITNVQPVALDCDHFDVARPDNPDFDVRTAHLTDILEKLRPNIGDISNISPIQQLLVTPNDKLPILIEELRLQARNNPDDLKLRLALSKAIEQVNTTVAAEKNVAVNVSTPSYQNSLEYKGFSSYLGFGRSFFGTVLFVFIGFVILNILLFNVIDTDLVSYILKRFILS